ncbi:MAG: zf-HC2 domain-containing protein [Armatimonadota bacterium]
MWCGRVRKQLSAYVDGELSATQEQSVEQHVTRCEQCAGELRELRGLSRLASLIPEEDLPTGLHARIMAGISGAKLAPVPAAVPRRHSLPYGPWAFTAFAGASALLLLGVMQSRAGIIPSSTPVEREPVIARTEPERPEQHASEPPVRHEERGAEAHTAHGPIRIARAPRPAPLPEVSTRSEVEPVREPVAAPVAEQQAAPAPANRRPQPTLKRRTEKPTEAAVSAPRPEVPGAPKPEVGAAEPRLPSTVPTAPTVPAVPGEPVMNMMPATREATMASMMKPGTAGMSMETRTDTGMAGMARMAGSTTPAEAESVPAKEEGLDMLRMLLEERSRTVPQPPSADPSRDRRRTRSL